MEQGKIGKHFDKIASEYDLWKERSDYYYTSIQSLLKKYIPSHSEVLELGCGTGTLLASVSPSLGVGMDYSLEMVKIAKEKFPQYHFFRGDAQNIALSRRFPYVIMVDIIDHIPDVSLMLSRIPNLLDTNGRCVITSINPLWQPIFWVSERLGLKMPEGDHRFRDPREIKGMIENLGLFVQEEGRLLLVPKEVPVVSKGLNTIAPLLPYVRDLCSTWYMVVGFDKGKEKNKGCLLGKSK
jgi:ubiquinone/menaquinone biosynthesis C-methylase UbiE